MPNHVMNVLKMKGITTLPLFIQDEDEGRRFDFNKIIPMPESLQVESGTIEDLAIEAVLRKLAVPQGGLYKIGVAPTMSDDAYLRTMKNINKSEEELCRLGLVYITNKALHGATSWYPWCCANWGTKWNSYDNEERSEDTIAFATAWSPPSGVIAQLAEMYPDAVIEHWWADENAGSNSGYARYKGNRADISYRQTVSMDAYKTYMFCWGEGECHYEDVDGSLYYAYCDDSQERLEERG